MEDNKDLSIEDLFALAAIEQGPDPNREPYEDPKRVEKNEASRTYYTANKDKIKATRTKNRVEKKRKECLEHGVPEYLADFISFYSDGRVVLTFKSENDLFRVLHWLKFKSTYTEASVLRK